MHSALRTMDADSSKPAPSDWICERFIAIKLDY